MLTLRHGTYTDRELEELQIVIHNAYLAIGDGCDLDCKGCHIRRACDDLAKLDAYLLKTLARKTRDNES